MEDDRATWPHAICVANGTVFAKAIRQIIANSFRPTDESGKRLADGITDDDPLVVIDSGLITTGVRYFSKFDPADLQVGMDAEVWWRDVIEIAVNASMSDSRDTHRVANSLTAWELRLEPRLSAGGRLDSYVLARTNA